jgi:hypothetical protein
MQLRSLLVVGLYALFAAATPAPARAQETCYDYCTNMCPAGDGRSECTDNCSIRCSPGGDLDETWSPDSAPYGALAYGAQSGAYGWAHNRSSADEADQVALSKCAQHGQDCKIVVRVTHSCAAVAAGSNGTVAAGTGSTQDQAQDNALTACRGDGGQSCDIQVWTCSP